MVVSVIVVVIGSLIGIAGGAGKDGKAKKPITTTITLTATKRELR